MHVLVIFRVKKYDNQTLLAVTVGLTAIFIHFSPPRNIFLMSIRGKNGSEGHNISSVLLGKEIPFSISIFNLISLTIVDYFESFT